MSFHVFKLPSDLTRRCLSAPESDGDAASDTALHNKAPTPLATFDSWTPTPILREWTKATLASGEWEDALVVAANVSISRCSGGPREIDTDGFQFTLPRTTIYRVMCEHLEAIDRVTDTIKCFHKMMGELGGEVYTSGSMTEWISGEAMFPSCLSAMHINVLVRFHPPMSLRSRR